jgi:hypothetical protein
VPYRVVTKSPGNKETRSKSFDTLDAAKEQGLKRLDKDNRNVVSIVNEDNADIVGATDLFDLYDKLKKPT